MMDPTVKSWVDELSALLGRMGEEATEDDSIALSALRQIATTQFEECRCDHSTEDCCAKVGEYCARCVAAYALVQSAGSLGADAPTDEKHWSATFHTGFGAKIWYDGRPMFQVISGVEDARVTPEDPKPQWLKCVEAVVDTMNAPSAAAPQAPAGWQPIETAPERRKVLVTWINALGKRRITVASYWPMHTLPLADDVPNYQVTEEGTNVDAGWWEESEGNDDAMFRLVETMTHWMPLPAPPLPAPAPETP
jgi:hypothetical protein